MAGEGHGVPGGIRRTRPLPAAVPRVRVTGAADPLREQRGELLRPLSDRRAVAGGPGAVGALERRLAALAGRTGSAAARTLAVLTQCFCTPLDPPWARLHALFGVLRVGQQSKYCPVEPTGSRSRLGGWPSAIGPGSGWRSHSRLSVELTLAVVVMKPHLHHRIRLLRLLRLFLATIKRAP